MATNAWAANLFTDTFESNPGNNLVPAGWTSIANWTKGPTATGTGRPSSFTTTGPGAGHPFYGHNFVEDPANTGRFIAATGNGASPSEIDLWTLTPSVNFNGSAAEISFWTFSMGSSTAYLEVRVGAGANATVPNNGGLEDNGLPSPLTGGVGDFSNLLLTVNPTRASGGYPTYTTPDFAPQWTQYTAVVPAGLISGEGRVAFRSWGTNQFGQPTTYRIVALDDISIDSIVIPEAQWAASVDGNWSNGSAWTGGTSPNGNNAIAILGSNGGAVSGARVITNDAAHAVGSLTFDHAAGYTINGAATLTIAQAAAPAVKVLQGTHAVTAPVTLSNNTTFDVTANSALTLGGSISAPGKAITKTGAGTLTIAPTSFGGLSVEGGKLGLAGVGNTTVASVAVASGAAVDLGNSSLVVDYAPGGSPLAAVKSAIADGRIGKASLNAAQAIGYVDTAVAGAITTHRGAAVDASSLAIAATLRGDANLDFAVNFDDLLALAQNYNQSGREWWNGEFSGNGTVDFDDLLALASNYNQSLSSATAGLEASFASSEFIGDWQLAASLVPEPASALLLSSFAVLPARRRRSAR